MFPTGIAIFLQEELHADAERIDRVLVNRTRNLLAHDFLAAHVSTKKVAIAPARFTASCACRAVGLTGFPPCPCASPILFRSEPRPSTTLVAPPRIRLKASSVCWLGAIWSRSATILYSFRRRYRPRSSVNSPRLRLFCRRSQAGYAQW